MDATSEGRLALVHPILADKIRQVAAQLAAEDIYVRVVQGLRTVEEQDSLYAIGRTQQGRIVTNCKGGHSYHNFGLACDVVPSEHGIDQSYNPDWNQSHPTWKRMVELGQQQGLTPGALWRTFPDWPHFQFTGRFPVGSPNDEVRQLFKDGGFKAVWEQVK